MDNFRHSAQVDALTQVSNRAHFVASAQLFRDHRQTISLVLFDWIFSSTSTTDLVMPLGIGSFARCAAIQSHLRKDRFVFGRLGGEEFALCLTGFTPMRCFRSPSAAVWPFCPSTPTQRLRVHHHIKLRHCHAHCERPKPATKIYWSPQTRRCTCPKTMAAIACRYTVRRLPAPRPNRQSPPIEQTELAKKHDDTPPERQTHLRRHRHAYGLPDHAAGAKLYRNSRRGGLCRPTSSPAIGSRALPKDFICVLGYEDCGVEGKTGAIPIGAWPTPSWSRCAQARRCVPPSTATPASLPASGIWRLKMHAQKVCRGDAARHLGAGLPGGGPGAGSRSHGHAVMETTQFMIYQRPSTPRPC